MARVKRGVTTHARHKKVLDASKGFVGRSSTSYRIALERLEKYLRAEGMADDAFFEQPIPFLGGQQARVLWREATRHIQAVAVHKQDAFASEVIAASRASKGVSQARIVSASSHRRGRMLGSKAIILPAAFALVRAASRFARPSPSRMASVMPER